MESSQPDAFSRTLETRPHRRISQHVAQPSASLTISHKEGAVDRLSRVFEQNAPPPPPSSRRQQDFQRNGSLSSRPALPAKPPSLRISSNFHPSQESHLPSPSSESMPSPASTATAATSVTSYTSDVHSHRRLSYGDDQEKETNKGEIDQTSLAFNDIRARFQQAQQQQQQPSPKPASGSNRYNGHAHSLPPSETRVPPPLFPQQMSAKHLPHIRNGPKPIRPTPRPDSSSNSNNINDNSTPPPTLPKTGTFVAELSKRLEQTEMEQQSTKPEGPPPVPARLVRSHHSGSLRKPSISTHGPDGHNLIPKRLSSSSLNLIPTSSSTTLQIPHVIPRSETTTSTTSTSSASSSLTAGESASRRAWHYGAAITGWFTGHESHQQQQSSLKDSITVISRAGTEDRPPSDTTCYTAASLPVSPQLSGRGADRGAKRVKVIDEIVSTERAYQKDMLLLKDLFYDRASMSDSPLDKSDVKTLFSNLLEIIDFEATFVRVLEAASEAADEDAEDNTSIGSSFRQMMPQIDEIYCEYCKRHEDAVIRLQELEAKPDGRAFLADCQMQLQGKSMSWDIGSLLIKPVQRVLKYPLLLRELLILTPPDHPDHTNLAAATQEIQEVADHINEIKRRKDIVEKIVGDKKKTEINVVHGINKKITRRAQRLKQVTGLSAEATQDASFDTLYLRFERQREVAQQLARDVQGWVRQVKNNFETLRLFAESLETLYGSWGGVRVKSMERVRDFVRATSMFSSVMTRELDSKVQGIVYSRIDSFLRVFENPGQVINKRAQKLLDYDRVRDMKSRGDTPDKQLQESADAYVSINAQLVEDLPKFFQLTGQYFDIIVGELTAVQMSFYQQMTREWERVIQQNSIKGSMGVDDIIEDYIGSMKHIEDLILDIAPINQVQWLSIPGAVPDTPPTDEKGSIQSMSTISYQDSYF